MFDARRARIDDAIRPLARRQFIEQHAQRIDVRRRADGAAAHLLGTGVFGCERAEHRACLRRRFVEQLGDAEIEQLRRAARIDEDVARV